MLNPRFLDFLNCTCSDCERMRSNYIRTLLNFIKNTVSRRLQRYLVKHRKKGKVFVLGQMKTGSTSLESFLKDSGYKLGDQRKFELDLQNAFDDNFNETRKLIDSAEAFQDLPFSFATPGLLKLLANHYPTAKFILCTRDPQLWYDSVDRFFRKRWFNHLENVGSITWEEIDQVQYHGNILEAMLRKRADRGKHGPLNKLQLIKSFNTHNQLVRNFFNKNSHLHFYECSVTCESFDIAALSKFLGLGDVLEFPHLNRTR